jgi:uncharacterized membrane protein (DUF2068 family)
MNREVSIPITNDLISKNLEQMIKHPNSMNIVKLLNDILINSPRASQYFVQMLLGSEFPEIPAINSVGYFRTSTWFEFKDNTVGSKFDVNGMIKCIVTGHNSIVEYSPLMVKYACLDSTGKETTGSTGLQLDQFIPEGTEDEF